jgi:hypothetical protein
LQERLTTTAIQGKIGCVPGIHHLLIAVRDIYLVDRVTPIFLLLSVANICVIVWATAGAGTLYI